MQLLSARAGHWTGSGTGVTVILPPPGTVGSGEVRGGAPATREFALLDPTRLVDRVDAVVLSGGSAFGLAAGDGVMQVLRERGLGFPTPFAPVPIVVGLSLFDGSVAGSPPTAESGRHAALAAFAGDGPLPAGRFGAGTGATTGKWRGRLDPGGLGVVERRAGAASVAAVVAVNAWGDVLGPEGHPVFAPDDVPGPDGLPRFAPDDVTGPDGRPKLASDSLPGRDGPPTAPFGTGNTTIAVLLTDAALSKTDCYLLAQSGHTGFARAMHPAHSRYDGDAVVALATGEITAEVDLDRLRATATLVMADAIRAAVAPGVATT